VSTQANKAVLQRFIDGYNRGDLSVIDTLVAEDFVDHSRPFVPPGRNALRAFHDALSAAISDIRIRIDELIAEGDTVVFRGVVTGTHTGPLLGVPATYRAFALGVIDINRIRDGQLVERWGVQDELGLLQQLGVLPTPGPSS
jgi:steroid delta-isomerase-like uncharacterized protein